MIILPIKHENMQARRWPMVTLALIALNTLVFLFTSVTANDQEPQLRALRGDIRILAAEHPDLRMRPEAQNLVDSFKQTHPAQWKQLQNANREPVNDYDSQSKAIQDPEQLQGEM